MQYRNLDKAGFSVSEIGIGGEYLEGKPVARVCDVISAAIDNGINILDIFMSNPEIRSSLGTALKGKRDKMHLQAHFRSIWHDNQYGRTLDFETVKYFFEDYFKRLGTDYIDIGTLHMIDNNEDYDKVINGPIMEYAQKLKEKGSIRAIGLSTHSPVQALKAAKTGLVDTILFSINPAYDLMDENEERPESLNSKLFENKKTINGINSMREEFYQYCAVHGIGITVMKTLGAGALLDARTSPFGKALTTAQCIHYALTRPGVASVLLGMQTIDEVKSCMEYEALDGKAKDYSFIFSESTKFSMNEKCVYCNHCLPCSAHIDIAQLGKYLDLALLEGSPSPTVRAHYASLEHKADECIQCGICETQCPFNVKIMDRMQKAAGLFG